MPLTNFAWQNLGGLVFGGNANDWTPPETLWLALSLSEPTQSSSGDPAWNFTEISDNGYARGESLAVDWVLTDPPPSAGAQWTTTATILLPVSTGAWGAGAAIPWAGLFDAETDGNLLAFGELLPAITVPGAGYVPQVSPGQPIVSLV